MKLIIKSILIATLAFTMQIWFPWFAIVPAALLVNILINDSHGKAFLSGFIGIGVLWFIKAYLVDSASDSDLADRIAQLLMVQNKYLLMLVTALIGGLVGGFSGLTGSTFRAMFVKKKSYYR